MARLAPLRLLTACRVTVCSLSLNVTDNTPLYYLLVDCSSAAATTASAVMLPTVLLLLLALVADRVRL